MSDKRKLSNEEVLKTLSDFKRRKCAEKGDYCAKCPQKYGNMCFATNMKNEICLN